MTVELYRRFGPIIYARCRRLLQDDAAAAAATEQIFLGIHRQLSSAPNDEVALAWIARVSSGYCAKWPRRALRLARSSAGYLRALAMLSRIGDRTKSSTVR